MGFMKNVTNCPKKLLTNYGGTDEKDIKKSGVPVDYLYNDNARTYYFRKSRSN